MLVDYNSESRIFFVVTDSYETVNVPYLLLDRDKKGDVFNENPDSYGYKIFYKRNYKENDIFQVIESDLDKRIGWIFPISSIVSISHDYADNPHYCRYALVAHMLLLRNEIAEQDIVSRDFSSIIESEYSDDAIILIYKKDLVQEVTGFKLDNYFASLCEYGYYIEHGYTNTNIKEPASREKNHLQSISEDIISDKYMNRFFRMLCREEHSIVKFHILYQIIELLIEDILIYSLEDTIRLFKDKKIYTRSLRERISKVESEKDRILILIEKCELHSEDYNSLHEKCVAFLVKKGRENVNFPESLYSVRNFIVHDYRFIVEETELAEINDINALFEMFVLDLIIKYKH